jgi:IS5 family transposase
MILAWGDAKMRRKHHLQRSLFHIMPKSKIGEELAEISELLDQIPETLELVHKDLVGSRQCSTGREGMTAEQVLRAAVVKQSQKFTYEELEFHLGDSAAFRAFTRLKVNQCPKTSALQSNIKALSETTWEKINRLIVHKAKKEGIEDGKVVRVDSTAVDADIHYPTDSSLLVDGIRVLTRLMIEGKQLSPRPAYGYHDHRRVAKKLALKILNAKKQKDRTKAYRELLQYSGRVRGYAVEAIETLRSWDWDNAKDAFTAPALASRIERTLGIFDRVVDQTNRRVIHGEQVPASEKVVSFFEEHTDIIVKKRRDTQYGHKVCLMGGKSNLILDALIQRGNPADTDLLRPMVERHVDIHGKVPEQLSADGGFASKDNLEWTKANGVKEVCFSKRRGLSIADMVGNSRIYKKLRKFRAGIEANISALKRAYGMRMCNWSGWSGFKSYIWSSVCSYNLFVLGRARLASE